MNGKKNPFKRWELVRVANKVKFYLRTFDHTKIHAATGVRNQEGKIVYSVEKKFAEAFPMVFTCMGEPSLFSLASVKQWLQNIILISSQAFVPQDPPKITRILNGQPWCYVLFCTDMENQDIPVEMFQYNGFAEGQTITVKHGLAEWSLKITDHCFGGEWNLFCKHNYIDLNDMLFLRKRSDFIYDALTFSSNCLQIWTRWTLPLSMIPYEFFVSQEDIKSQPSATLITSSINRFFSHDLMALDAFYQIFSSDAKYSMEVPEHAHPRLHESRTPTMVLTSGTKNYIIGMTDNRFHQNWNKFVDDHGLHQGEILVFIPQSRTSLTVLIFGINGIEIMYPWHHTFYL